MSEFKAQLLGIIIVISLFTALSIFSKSYVDNLPNKISSATEQAVSSGLNQ